MDSIRQNKIGRLLQKELAVIFQQEGRRLSEGGLITVTVVRVSPDLGVAKVYISILSPKDKEEVLDNVKNHTSQIRGALGHRVGKQLRRVPELIFYRDDSLDRSELIDKLIKE